LKFLVGVVGLDLFSYLAHTLLHKSRLGWRFHRVHHSELEVDVTPDMHKVHHSRLQHETDSNYANIFSCWDRLFGTYTANLPLTELRYGLDGFEGAAKQHLRALLLLPFTTCR
jgi:sterol desaturase/sphingolipid hydroxylase (fatty acid hydroxylase superfamily)